jgi:hypothetical protein
LLVSTSFTGNFQHPKPTQVLSEIDSILGAYGEVGRLDFCDGDPKPDIPDTLYLLLDDVDIVGRVGSSGGGRLAKDWRFEAEFELVRIGGVVPPNVEFNVEEDFVAGTEPLVPLLESVDLSVLKLALERLRMSFKNEGAIIHLRIRNKC